MPRYHILYRTSIETCSKISLFLQRSIIVRGSGLCEGVQWLPGRFSSSIWIVENSELIKDEVVGKKLFGVEIAAWTLAWGPQIGVTLALLQSGYNRRNDSQ